MFWNKRESTEIVAEEPVKAPVTTEISKDELRKLIIFVKGSGYKLNPKIKILGGGQKGIRKTEYGRKPKKA